MKGLKAAVGPDKEGTTACITVCMQNSVFCIAGLLQDSKLSDEQADHMLSAESGDYASVVWQITHEPPFAIFIFMVRHPASAKELAFASPSLQTFAPLTTQ